jgi:GMP synthase-like glutamine amidotransferase
MKTVHVVQHTSAEYLGLIEDHLEGRGIRFIYSRPFAAKGSLPPAKAVVTGLVLLGGGPWGTTGERCVPTLAAEIDLARSCLARTIPVVGIGLGAQILAIAAGGGSEAAALDFSVGQAHRSQSDALGGYLPERYPVCIYMRDRPLPPADATVLAQDDADRPALWQYGRVAFGFSGHPGLKLAMIEDLAMEFEESPPALADGLARLRLAQRGLEDALVPIMTGLVQATGWMDADAP